MKTYQPEEWGKLIDHAVATGDWATLRNQAARIKHLLLYFFPVTNESTCPLEQFAVSMPISDWELIINKVDKPTREMETAKIEQAKAALIDCLSEHGLDRGLFRKDKWKADRLRFKHPYTSSFGTGVICGNCQYEFGRFEWTARRGDWTIRCKHCGWKKVYRRGWIENEFLDNKRIAQRENAKIRPFATSETEHFFFMKLRCLMVPDEDDAVASVKINA